MSFFNAPVVSKRLELARELARSGSAIAMLVNPNNPPSAEEGAAAQKATAAVGQALLIVPATTQDEIDGSKRARRYWRAPPSNVEGLETVALIKRKAVTTRSVASYRAGARRG